MGLGLLLGAPAVFGYNRLSRSSERFEAGESIKAARNESAATRQTLPQHVDPRTVAMGMTAVFPITPESVRDRSHIAAPYSWSKRVPYGPEPQLALPAPVRLRDTLNIDRSHPNSQPYSWSKAPAWDDLVVPAPDTAPQLALPAPPKRLALPAPPERLALPAPPEQPRITHTPDTPRTTPTPNATIPMNVNHELLDELTTPSWTEWFFGKRKEPLDPFADWYD